MSRDEERRRRRISKTKQQGLAQLLNRFAKWKEREQMADNNGDAIILRNLAGVSSVAKMNPIVRDILARALSRLGVERGEDLIFGDGANAVTPEQLQEAFLAAAQYLGYNQKDLSGTWTAGNIAAALRRWRDWNREPPTP